MIVTKYFMMEYNVINFPLDDAPFLMIMKDKQIVDMRIDSNTGETEGFLSPIVGVENGLSIDYDRQKEEIYWVELDEEESDEV